MMNLTNFFYLIVNFFNMVIDELENARFSLFGYNVNLLGIIVAFLVVAMILSVFYRGAKA